MLKVTKGIRVSNSIVFDSCWAVLITDKEPYAYAQLTEISRGIQQCQFVSLTSCHQLHCPGVSHCKKLCSHYMEDVIYFPIHCRLVLSAVLFVAAYLNCNESSTLIRMTKAW